jgi:four helix bundle protein
MASGVLDIRGDSGGTGLGFQLPVCQMPVASLTGVWQLENWHLAVEGFAMQDFKNVDVWKRAHALTLNVYRESQGLPKDEAFGITVQVRRAAIMIARHIAEGCGRDGNLEFAVDLRKAAAGTNDLEYLILLAYDLEHLKQEVYERLTDGVVEVRKMIYGLLRKM